MPDDIPSLMKSLDAPDDVRAAALAAQAQLPSDLVDPRDVMGPEAWDREVLFDRTGGIAARADFDFRWDWQTTPGQRAAALADRALAVETGAFVDAASDLAVKPPVDPAAFADRIRSMRAERARRI